MSWHVGGGSKGMRCMSYLWPERLICQKQPGVEMFKVNSIAVGYLRGENEKRT